MRRETKLLWVDDNGRELIVKKENEYQVIPAFCGKETLCQLLDAICDILGIPLYPHDKPEDSK